MEIEGGAILRRVRPISQLDLRLNMRQKWLRFPENAKIKQGVDSEVRIISESYYLGLGKGDDMILAGVTIQEWGP